MDWKTIAPIVGAVAPLAGSILGGLIPIPGGSLIGQKFGEIIARQFGVDPKATDAAKQVSDAIGVAGEETARAKINAALEQARAEIDGFVALEKATLDATVKNLADVNATIRVEATSTEPFFYRGWRPTAGWLYVVMMSVFGVLLAWAIGKTVAASSDPLAVLTNAWPLFVAYVSALALVNGVLIPSRSIEKRAAIENHAPMPNTSPPQPVPQPKPAPLPKTFIGKPPGSKD